jgi:IMP dehydrogenase
MYKVGRALCFDDILLVPQKSSVVSRHDVDLTMSIGYKKRKIDLSLPIIASPMDTVCDVDMCIAMAKVGGIGILHRYMSYPDQIIKSQTLIEQDVRFGVAIASNNGYLAQADHLYNIGVRFFLVDTANGHSSYAIKAVAQLRNAFSNAHIMAGNVATKDGFLRLAEAGADSVRVGIGGGGACTTRIVSGHGVPTLQSILDVSETFQECSVVADGGIRNSGDIVKAFAAGANAVMLGSMLAGTDEAPGEILTDHNNREVKAFRGMASAAAQKDATGKISVAEGISTNVPYKGSVTHILNQISGGLGSGCSYTGVDKLSYLEEFAEYVTVSGLSINESIPHAKLS